MLKNWQYYDFSFSEERECKGLTFCPIKCPKTTILSFFSEGAKMAANFTFAKAEIYFGDLINQTLDVSLVENKQDNQAGKPSIYLHWEFSKFWHSPVWNIQFDELDFFFLVWKQSGYFYQFKLIFSSSFWTRVKYFDGPCLTIYSLFTIYRDIHY